MLYRDNQIANDNQCRSICKGLSIVRAQELNDLRDIYDRMKDQHNLMTRNNSNGKFSDMLEVTADNMRVIERMISRNNDESNNSIRRSNPNTKNNINDNCIYNTYNNRQVRSSFARALNDPNVYGKVPHEDEMLRVNPNDDIITDNQENISNNTNDMSSENLNNTDNRFPSTGRPDINPPTTDRPSTIPDSSNSTRRRVFPMQGSVLDNIAKSLFMSRTKSQSKVDSSNPPRSLHHDSSDCGCFPYRSSCPHSIDKHKHEDCDNRESYYKHDICDKCHFNDDYDDDRCVPHRKMVTGQIDLLRLLILFISMRPRCKHVPRLCSIADEQMGVLLNLID